MQQINRASLRRRFLTQSALALAGVTAGTLSWPACSSSTAVGLQMGSAAFQWETAYSDNQNAFLYFEVLADVLVTNFCIGLAFGPSSSVVAGGASLHCQGSTSRGRVPALPFTPRVTADFGSVATYNPNRLNLLVTPVLYQDVFCSVILNAWVPADGTKSATFRQVSDLVRCRFTTRTIYLSTATQR